MTRHEFALRLEAARRRADNIIWSFYISTLVAMYGVVGLAVVYLCISLLTGVLKGVQPERAAIQIGVVWLIASCLAVIGIIKATQYIFWTRWLQRMGMQCPACGNFLSYHWGNQYDSPPCACDGTTHCRKVWDTGVCDKCGERIFELSDA